ncbi:MAG TPA: hypothetical protein VGB82_04070 [Alphaproteobacteria bacterium]
MRATDLYGRYRQAIERLAQQPSLPDRWRKELDDLIRRLEAEAGEMDAKTTRSLCDELCEQLEQEALRATGAHRGAVLLAAVKGLESISLPAQK